MIPAKELKRWLNTLPDDAGVMIDEGGLTLMDFEDQEGYIEVGGEPLDGEDDS